jgi:hypothetical protein
MTTEEHDQKKIRNRLHPVDIFIVFFLVGPLLGALLVELAHILFLLIWGYHFLELAARSPGMLVGFATGEAIIIYFFGLPAGFLVAVCALSSYFVYRRVRFIVVLAAALAAIGLENLTQYRDVGYMAFGEDREGVIDGWSAAVQQLLMHVVPATICWALVRNERLRPSASAWASSE